MSDPNGKDLRPPRQEDVGLSRRRFLKEAGGLGAAGSLLLMLPVQLRADTGPIKIGIMGPFTGPASRTGEDIKAGAMMGLDDARAAGQVPLTIDGQKRDVELVWVDSQSDPEKAVKAVTDAVTHQGVQFMVTGWHSSVAMAVIDAEVPMHIVHIGHMGESQFIDEKINTDPKKYRGWFKGWPAPPIFAGLYGPPLEYFEKQGLWKPANRKAAVLVEDTDYGRGWGEALTASLKQAGFDPLPYDVTALDETEFTPLLIKYKAQGVSVMAMTTTGSVSASNFVKQFRNQDMKALLIGHGLTWFSEWYKLTGDASNFVVTSDSPRVVDPDQQKWVDRFTKQYGHEPSLAAAGMPYDYVRMAFTIINKTGSLDFDKLVAMTEDTPYKGVWQYYQFSKEKGPNALAPHDVETGAFMEGFFFPMVQLMNGDAKIIWPLKFAQEKFQAPPWLNG
ncbi:MAG: ABC transporter substrate-binding protein [Arenicellales bacterium]